MRARRHRHSWNFVAALTCISYIYRAYKRSLLKTKTRAIECVCMCFCVKKENLFGIPASSTSLARARRASKKVLNAFEFSFHLFL